jgi:hypothetical protein
MAAAGPFQPVPSRPSLTAGAGGRRAGASRLLFGEDDDDDGPGPPGVGQAPAAFAAANPFCVAVLYGRAGRLTAQNGYFPARV